MHYLHLGTYIIIKATDNYDYLITQLCSPWTVSFTLGIFFHSNIKYLILTVKIEILF